MHRAEEIPPEGERGSDDAPVERSRHARSSGVGPGEQQPTDWRSRAQFAHPVVGWRRGEAVDFVLRMVHEMMRGKRRGGFRVGDTPSQLRVLSREQIRQPLACCFKLS